MSILTGDFREQPCPPGAALVLVDPPYGLGKKYAGQVETRAYQEWARDLLGWWCDSDCPRIMIMGPALALYDWLPLVPRPTRIIWWHRTFLGPRSKLRAWVPSTTPIIIYETDDAPWHGPERSHRDFHDVLDSHSSMGDKGRLNKVFPNGSSPYHPSMTGTKIAEKIIGPTTAPGDLVVDPMCGLGSILVAALRLGRRQWGCEVGEEYAEASRTWLAYEEELLAR